MSAHSRSRAPSTALCYSTEDEILIHDTDLCRDLIGKVNLTQMLFFDIFGRMPTEIESKVLDAMMVTLMEHGMTPASISARLTYSSAPEALQGAVAAGLLSAGSVLLGTMERCATLLERIVKDPAGIETAARREADEHVARGDFIPGFGHPFHHPDDPRTTRLFALAAQWGLPGRHVAAAQALSKAVDAVNGKHLTMNASTALGALACEIALPLQIVRGFAVICRCAGLVAHVYEEQRDPAARTMWDAALAAVPYRTADGTLKAAH